jgi:hypothetical protein
MAQQLGRLRNLKNGQEFEHLMFYRNRADQKTSKHDVFDHLQVRALKVRLRGLDQLRQQICLVDMFCKALMTRGEPNPV